MTTLKDKLKPLGQKHKFNYLIKDMDDDEIIEFIEEEILLCKIASVTSFEEARKYVPPGIDGLIPLTDQQELYNIVKSFSS